MSEVEFKKHRVFRETQDVIFYDISVDESNASDLSSSYWCCNITSRMILSEQNNFTTRISRRL